MNNQLSAVLNHAARYYGLHPNPAVCTMKMGGKETSEMQFWTKEEYLKFADEMMEKPREFLMFEILYWTGIREGEMLALMPSAFDPQRGTMRIDKSYQRFDGRDGITDPKTPPSRFAPSSSRSSLSRRSPTTSSAIRKSAPTTACSRLPSTRYRMQ